jgi:hypothetical protein
MLYTLLRTMRQVSKVLGQIVGHLCIRNFFREVLGKLQTGKTGPVSRPGTRFSVAAALACSSCHQAGKGEIWTRTPQRPRPQRRERERDA